MNLDDILVELRKLKEDLFIVVIGANNGLVGEDYVPALIKDTGCSGILIEPIYYYLKQFKKLLGSHGDRIKFDSYAVSDDGSKKFTEFHRIDEDFINKTSDSSHWLHGQGTFDLDFLKKELVGNHGDPKEPNKLFKSIVTHGVMCKPINSILGDYHVKLVNLLQIDTQGSDCKILNTLDFASYAPEVIRFETVRKSKEEDDCRDMLERKGYRMITTNGEADTIAIKGDLYE